MSCSQLNKKKKVSALSPCLQEEKVWRRHVRWRMTHAAGGSWIDENEGGGWVLIRYWQEKYFHLTMRYFSVLFLSLSLPPSFSMFTSHWLANPLTLVPSSVNYSWVCFCCCFCFVFLKQSRQQKWTVGGRLLEHAGRRNEEESFQTIERFSLPSPLRILYSYWLAFTSFLA